MKFLGWSRIIFFCLIACASLASADTLQLRNGRRLQGKFIGGTTTAIGFMSGASVEYFPTADVLALIFDNNADPSLGGNQPSPMSGDCSMGVAKVTDARHVLQLDSNAHRYSITSPWKNTSGSDDDLRSFELSDQLWFSSL